MTYSNDTYQPIKVWISQSFEIQDESERRWQRCIKLLLQNVLLL